MKGLLVVHLATLIVASSYLTLGIFAPDRAGGLWAPYAVVTFILAALALYLEHERRHARST
jgi:hypothetical protein